MKKLILIALMVMIGAKVVAQEVNPTVVLPYQYDTRVITTGVPFLMITSDARAGGMGEIVLQHRLMFTRNSGILLNIVLSLNL